MRLRKSQIRAAKTRKEAQALLSAIAGGNLDPYEGYARLNVLWVSTNSAVQELRPLFRIPGIDANSTFSVTDELRGEIIDLARRILPLFQN